MKSKLKQITGNKIHFISLGCPRNLVDTEVMLGILLKAGFEPTQNLQEADFIVINTCSFLKEARDESFSTIDEAVKDKKKGAKVIATGCLVQKHKKDILKKLSSVDFLLGSGDIYEILKAIESGERDSIISDKKSFLEMGEVPRALSTPKHYAYLKIAEGCRKKCSYCSIPSIKGPLKSKPIEQIIKEFKTLLKHGVQEIILIAQDLGDWGKDLGYRGPGGLVALLKEMLKIKGDFWLRLLYLYPDEITDELINLMKSDKRILPYLDMPIQHVNDDLLKAMRRTTCRKDIEKIIINLRSSIPEITIRTSLIVGFPGETKEQFDELAKFLKKYKLDNVGIFKYSREEDTRAFDLPGQISEEEKEKRFDRLMKIQQKIVLEKNKSKIGQKLETFVEGYHPESNLLMLARHMGQCPEIDSHIIINDGRKVTEFGQKYLVEITDTAGYDLIGKVLN